MTKPESGREPSEMVERVARALAVEDSCDPDFIDRAGRVQWTYHIGAASVAIGALRQPTKAMVSAGMIPYRDGRYSMKDAEAVKVWPRMIDAALGAGQAEGEG